MCVCVCNGCTCVGEHGSDVCVFNENLNAQKGKKIVDDYGTTTAAVAKARNLIIMMFIMN